MGPQRCRDFHIFHPACWHKSSNNVMACLRLSFEAIVRCVWQHKWGGFNTGAFCVGVAFLCFPCFSRNSWNMLKHQNSSKVDCWVGPRSLWTPSAKKPLKNRYELMTKQDWTLPGTLMQVHVKQGHTGPPSPHWGLYSPGSTIHGSLVILYN